ncbi:MAG: tetratricopeptide repeat protein [Flavobacterium sp.]|nr:tetratricopeptide repeat protein [Flavobacterium sp.]
MKQTFIVTILFVIILASCSDSPPVNEEGIDDVRRHLDSVASSTIDKDRDIHNNEAYEALANLSNDTLKKKYLFQIATNFYENGNLHGFRKSSSSLFKLASKLKDTADIARSQIYLAEYYKNVGVLDSAFHYYLKAEKLLLNKKDFNSLADVYLRKADLQAVESDFFGSEKSALEALALLRGSSDAAKLFTGYNLIGISSNEFGDYLKAVEYFTKSLAVTDKLPPEDRLYFRTISLNNIGNAYQRMENFREAIRYFESALTDNKVESEYPDLYATILDNMAYSRFKIRDARDLPSLFYKSLRIRTELNLQSKLVLSNIHLSEYYEGFNKDSAIYFAKAALNLARIENFPLDVLTALQQISKVDSMNSGKYALEYIVINDSLHQKERKLKDRFARIQYETDEISQQRNQLEEQNRNLVYYFGATLLIGLLLFVIRNQRARNRELLLKQAQQNANEDIYNLMISQQNQIEEGRIREKKRIAKELHDGVLGRLFGTRLNLDSLNHVTSDDAVLKRNNYLKELKLIEQDIREISHDLNREKYVLINNFIAILNNLIEEQRVSHLTKVDVEMDPEIKWESINNTIKINLYRILQEGLQNINKYAKAKRVNISIILSEGKITLVLADDGIGFNLGAKKKGIGINNMITRTHELGGTIDIKSKRDRGTKIIISLPAKGS